MTDVAGEGDAEIEEGQNKVTVKQTVLFKALCDLLIFIFRVFRVCRIQSARRSLG